MRRSLGPPSARFRVRSRRHGCRHARERVVGVIGGGQLGRMLALAGLPLGIRCRFLDPSPDACAAEVGELIVGAYDDPCALRHVAAGADAVTYEFENVPVAAARSVGAVPEAAALEHGQDRLAEKLLFRRLGIDTARFGSLAETGRARARQDAAARLRRQGSADSWRMRRRPWRTRSSRRSSCAFDRELSVLAVRGRDGDTRFWPRRRERPSRRDPARLSRAPAVDPPQREAEAIATALLDALDYVGVLAVELFQVGDRLLANEFAPRVHNTGHWTIEGAETSQFENHLRAVLGLPLGSTALRAPSVMANLIGEPPPLDELLAIPGAHVHLYGKEPRAGRKVGHVTLVGGRGGGRDAGERRDGLRARVRLRGRRRRRVGAPGSTSSRRRRVGDVRVALRRRQVGMPEQLLDASEIRAALQQVRRERVTQQVRMDALGLEPGLLRQLPQDQEHPGPRRALRRAR